uniref:Retrovirus-related Pol polyprotein from transposon TNT 1-94 n=1 Tax=Tanacetum cinerariifolium TaxID=118510 RepID=A0A6L2JDE2_TANCI|nr:retrovirus-related Pol polyprotein from transposon TNT 1-94 [Tanacetum cinerariifolium]
MEHTYHLWRNKPEIDTLSLDDLYNNLKIYEPEVKGTSSSNTNTQNVSFVPLNTTSNTNGAVNAAHGVTTASTQATVVNTTTIGHLSVAVICSFFASQPNSLQLDNEDLQQIHPNDLEDIDLSKLIECQIVDKCKIGLGYNVVPPPYTGNFLPPKPDLCGLEEFVNKPIVTEPTVKKPAIETSEAKASVDKPKVVRNNFGPLLIEDWISGSKNEAESKPQIEKKTIKPSFAKIEFIKSKEQGVNTANRVNTASSQVNSTSSLNIGNLSDVVICAFIVSQPNSTQLVYEDLEQIHPNDLEEMDLKWKMAMLTMRARRFLKNTGRKLNLNGNDSVSFDKIKMECYNYHKRGHFARECQAPKGQDNMSRDVIRKTVPVETPNSSALVSSLTINADRPFNDVHPKRTMNVVNQESYFSKQAHSFVQRPNQKLTTLKNSYANKEVKTICVKKVNTAKPKAAVNAAKAKAKHNAVKGKRGNAVKSSTCWGNPQEHLQDKRVIDSGCYRHMTGNMSFLTDYEEIEGGYVAFGGNPKGGKITGKGTKDETSGTLKSFIPRVENLMNLRYILARTPQQNRFTERRTKTLIEAARTMLADLKLPTIFWAEAVNTACYVQNRTTKTSKISYLLVSYLKWNPRRKRAIGSKWVFRNKMNERGIVIRNKARLVAQGHTQEEGIDYDKVFAPVAGVEAIRLFLAYASFKDFIVYQMDVKSVFLYGKIEEEVYVFQPPGFEDPDFPDKVYKFEKALYDVKKASTPTETSKPLLKDENGEEVDVHLYRSMIGFLMYLTSSRPNIMFVVCAYPRYQVTPKVSHLHAVKRIFRYLKGQPKLGLWYPKDSSFDLLAYTNSDYAGCKKQTVVANSTTEAEYADASSRHNLIAFLEKPSESDGFEQIVNFINANQIKYALTLQALIDGKKDVINEASIRHNLKLNDVEVTPLFGTMMVQALKEVGDLPTDVRDTPISDKPSSSQPQRKHKPRRKQMMETKGRKIADIDVDAEVNLEKVYNLDMAHEETVLSMQDVDVQSERIEDVVKDVEDVNQKCL